MNRLIVINNIILGRRVAPKSYLEYINLSSHCVNRLHFPSCDYKRCTLFFFLTNCLVVRNNTKKECYFIDKWMKNTPKIQVGTIFFLTYKNI